MKLQTRGAIFRHGAGKPPFFPLKKLHAIETTQYREIEEKKTDILQRFDVRKNAPDVIRCAALSYVMRKMNKPTAREREKQVIPRI